ncbi:MAG: hypothetical protein HY241_01975 [Actinobacteria bacterium]|nr:hypothetical protein [Actinomycetota bacterium]
MGGGPACTVVPHIKGLEHGDDSFLFDADLGDECLDDGFAFGGCAVGDDPVEGDPDAVDGAGWWRGGGLVEGVGQFVLTDLELVDVVGEFFQALPAGGVDAPFLKWRL